MSSEEPLIQSVADTARWAAVYREQESRRPNRLFHDPFAGRLAGERGRRIAEGVHDGDKKAWAWIIRTYLFDSFIREQIASGVDTVVNLAAGLCTRPYRMELPPSLEWVEVDLPEVLDYKEEVLRDETPVCRLERVRMDLADIDERRALFQRLGGQGRRALIITEGLLIYLSAAEAAALARDLATPPGFRSWALELVSPGLLRMIQKEWSAQLMQAPLRFGPEEGPAFFESHGWRPADVRPVLKAAAKMKRAPGILRLLALLPQSDGPQGRRPWSAVILYSRAAATNP